MNVIDKACERIERDGWWKGGFRAPDDNSTCLVLAMEADRMGGLLDAFAAVKAELGVNDLDQVYEFNDDPSTTLEDVLLVMKRASARVDEEAAS